MAECKVGQKTKDGKREYFLDTNGKCKLTCKEGYKWQDENKKNRCILTDKRLIQEKRKACEGYWDGFSCRSKICKNKRWSNTLKKCVETEESCKAKDKLFDENKAICYQCNGVHKEYVSGKGCLLQCINKRTRKREPNLRTKSGHCPKRGDNVVIDYSNNTRRKMRKRNKNEELMIYDLLNKYLRIEYSLKRKGKNLDKSIAEFRRIQDKVKAFICKRNLPRCEEYYKHILEKVFAKKPYLKKFVDNNANLVDYQNFTLKRDAAIKDVKDAIKQNAPIDTLKKKHKILRAVPKSDNLENLIKTLKSMPFQSSAKSSSESSSTTSSVKTSSVKTSSESRSRSASSRNSSSNDRNEDAINADAINADAMNADAINANAINADAINADAINADAINAINEDFYLPDDIKEYFRKKETRSRKYKVSDSMEKLLTEVSSPRYNSIGYKDGMNEEKCYSIHEKFSFYDLLVFVYQLPKLKHIVIALIQNIFYTNVSPSEQAIFIEHLALILPSTNIICMNLGEIQATPIAWRHFRDVLPETNLGGVFIESTFLFPGDRSKISEILLENQKKHEYRRLVFENYENITSYTHCWKELNIDKKKADLWQQQENR
jgi:hypothetical protein